MLDAGSCWNGCSITRFGVGDAHVSRPERVYIVSPFSYCLIAPPTTSLHAVVASQTMSGVSHSLLRGFRSCRFISKTPVFQIHLRQSARPLSRYTQPLLAPAAPSANSSTAQAASTEKALKSNNGGETSSAQVDGSISLQEDDVSRVDWSKSYHGLSQEAFSAKAAEILLAPLDPEIVEIKPDGIIYLPEIHYRRILNRAFGPGAWGLAPRGETIVTDKAVTREYALVALGR